MNKSIRTVLVVVLIAVIMLVAGLTLRTSVTARHGEQIRIESFAWGVSQGQLLRICMGDLGTGSSAGRRENISFIFAQIEPTFGNVILERSLEVPTGQFRCTDFSHPELLAAGLVPEPNTRVQFMVTVGLNETTTVGAAQRATVGAAETITIASGRTENYKTIQTRQTTIIQDL
jgi:hypothetical protein